MKVLGSTGIKPAAASGGGRTLVRGSRVAPKKEADPASTTPATNETSATAKVAEEEKKADNRESFSSIEMIDSIPARQSMAAGNRSSLSLGSANKKRRSTVLNEKDFDQIMAGGGAPIRGTTIVGPSKDEVIVEVDEEDDIVSKNSSI